MIMTTARIMETSDETLGQGGAILRFVAVVQKF
jgi:hypothetical protein